MTHRKLSQGQAKSLRETASVIGRIPGATNTLKSLVRRGLATWSYESNSGTVRKCAILTDAGIIARKELRSA